MISDEERREAAKGLRMEYEQFLADVVITRDRVEDMGGTLSRVKSVLSAVPDLVQKNERLEKEIRKLKGENAVLMAQLDDWNGNAEGFQPDAYMKLPLDVDGEPIRVGDVLYSSGNEFRVVNIIVNANEVCVDVYADDGKFCPLMNPKYLSHKNPEPLESEPADSWEKLEEDAMKTICDYASAPLDADGVPMCDGCRFEMRGPCLVEKDLDMVKRAKKLAGIEGEAQQ